MRFGVLVIAVFCAQFEPVHYGAEKRWSGPILGNPVFLAMGVFAWTTWTTWTTDFLCGR